MLGSVCFLVLGILSVRSELLWDIAVTTGKQFELYKNDIKVYNGVDQFKNLTALAYDAVHNTLLFVDRQDGNAFIFSYDLTTKKQAVLVKSTSDIHGLAFDPVQRILFWTDTIKRSIHWMSMETSSQDNYYSTLIQFFDDKMPTAIAVDSCKGYLYWTSANLEQYTIEKARFDGTEFEEIAHADGTCLSLAIDQQTKKIYWGEGRNNNQYSIESADFNGNNRKTLIVGAYFKPTALTVSKDSIYWVNSGNKALYKLSKDPAKDEKLIYMELDDDAKPFGIAAYYPVEVQINGQDECVAPTKLSQYDSAVQDYDGDDEIEADLVCVNGIKLNGLSLCQCLTGYTGWRCDVSVCYNYCLHGDCFFEDNEPKCSCEAGYKGTRCEVDMCEGYCLNEGSCIPIEGSEPGCLCVEGYEGLRCEVSNTPMEIVQYLAPLCTCNGKQNYDKSLHQSGAIFTIDNFKSVIRNMSVIGIFDPKVLVMGLCMVCGMFLGMTIQHRMHLLTYKARNNNMAVYKLPPTPMPMDWPHQEKIFDDKSIKIKI